MLTRFDVHGLTFKNKREVDVECQTDPYVKPVLQAPVQAIVTQPSVESVTPVSSFDWVDGPVKLKELLLNHWEVLLFLAVLVAVTFILSIVSVGMVSNVSSPASRFNLSFNYEDAVSRLDLSSVDGQWGSWNIFMECSQNCLEVYKHESRQCNNPEPKGEGSYCVGSAIKSTPCGSEKCSWHVLPVDGGWSAWSEFLPCKQMCKERLSFSTRECNNPSPLGGGKMCPGNYFQAKPCGTKSCSEPPDDKCYPCAVNAIGLCHCVGLVAPVKDCKEALDLGFNVSGIYELNVYNKPLVLCDQETDGGGWTVFQKRITDREDFYRRDWTEYKNGFGSFSSGYWLGNEAIHQLTFNHPSELYIQVEDQYSQHGWARYDSFRTFQETSKYMLAVSGWTASHMANKFDSLGYSNYQNFVAPGEHYCASYHQGGWWFKTNGQKCTRMSLNGMYYHKEDSNYFVYYGIYWGHNRFNDSLKETEMKFRRKI